MEYKKNLITLIKICEYQDKLIKELQRIIDNAPPIKIGNKTPVWENLVARGGFEPPTPGL